MDIVLRLQVEKHVTEKNVYEKTIVSVIDVLIVDEVVIAVKNEIQPENDVQETKTIDKVDEVVAVKDAVVEKKPKYFPPGNDEWIGRWKR